LKQRRLGKAGPEVSAIGLGCNNFGYIDLEASRAVVHKALDLGVTFFDTSDVYGLGASETHLGEILIGRRADVILATKFGVGHPSPAPVYNSASRAYIFGAVERSLKRLRTDYIDLYQSHFPDWETPLEETLVALSDLVKQGKVRFVGLSNYEGWQAADAAWMTKVSGLAPIVSMQNEYNLLTRQCEASVFPAVQHFEMGFLPWSPLASGLLTGKYKNSEPLPKGTRLATPKWKTLKERALSERNWEILGRLEKFASTHGCSILELTYAWLNSRAAISSVIAGATKPEQLEANVKAAEHVLSAEEIAELDEMTDPVVVPPLQRAKVHLRI
jgi:aryl-alcohol dehydrogenase-like predicted oxidoreductase